MADPINKGQVKAILAKYGVTNPDQLANLISGSSLDSPDAPDINLAASSWIKLHAPIDIDE